MAANVVKLLDNLRLITLISNSQFLSQDCCPTVCQQCIVLMLVPWQAVTEQSV